MKGFRNHSLLFVFLSTLLIACSTSAPGLFGKQNPHEQYAQKLTNAGLKETAIGNLWFTAAERALANPITISLPHKEAGYFAADKPGAVGLQFGGKQGEKLVFQIKRNPSLASRLYADLWEVTTAKPTFLRSIDTTQQTFELEIKSNTDRYILRLQPELLKSMDYELSISIAPSLAFPVSGQNARIASIWGDARDAGARKHEGIDIFAPKRTPAIAAENGTITAVNENNLGGRVIWLRPQNKNYTLYYAHLDEQLASAGQRVTRGDTIGLIGNTGNARTTPPHLHFGIYALGGAVDPLPFVNPSVKKGEEPRIGIDLKNEKLRFTKRTTITNETFAQALAPQTIATPVAATAKSFRVLLSNGVMADVEKSALQSAAKPIKNTRLKQDSFLLDNPSADAARIKSIKANTTLEILGVTEQWSYVRNGDEQGWIATAMVE